MCYNPFVGKGQFSTILTPVVRVAIAIGKLLDGLGGSKGAISEVRISNIRRTADWFATQHNDLISPSVFYSVGGEETVAP